MSTQPFNGQHFRVTFSRLPGVVYMSQRVSVPGYNMSPVARPTPFTTIFEPGDHVQHDALIMSFLLDEDWDNWLSIQEWITDLTQTENFDQYDALRQSDHGLTSEASVLVYNSSNNPVKEMVFTNVFPTQLSGFELDSTITLPTPIPIQAAFSYDLLKIKKL